MKLFTGVFYLLISGSLLLTACGSSEDVSASSSGGGPTITCSNDTYYLAVDGSDNNDGSANNEWASFVYAFDNLKSGDRLIIRNGNYTEAFGTSRFSNGVRVVVSNPPSGDDVCPTNISAENDGGVIINGDFYIGNDYIDLEGLRFISNDGGIGSIRGNYVNIRRTSFHGNQNDPDEGLVGVSGTHILIEDSWVSGVGRSGFSAGSGANNDPTTGHHITFRRVVVSLKDYTGPHEYVGILLYGAKDIIIENAIIIDYGVIPDNGFGYAGGIRSRYGYGAHTHNFYGSLVLNNPFDGYLVTVGGCENCIAWDVSGRGIAQRHQGSGTSGHDFHKITVGSANDGISNFTHDYTNTLVINSGGDSNIGGDFNHFFNSTSSSQGSNSLNSDPQIKYILRTEPGTSAYQSGINSESRGAEMIYRYVDGVETSVALWPWQYEARLKKEMCTDIGVTDGFCASGNGLYGGPITLTSYIWEYLGEACPIGIC